MAERCRTGLLSDSWRPCGSSTAARAMACV